MMSIKKLTGYALLSMAFSSHAGFYANTAHSRGNCMGFNESITWNWNEYHWWEVESVHFKKKGSGPNTHKLIAPMANTWRAAAFDFWKDPSGGNADQYWVQGYHYYLKNNGTRAYDTYTESGDCSGYDGWWDKNTAQGE